MGSYLRKDIINIHISKDPGVKGHTMYCHTMEKMTKRLFELYLSKQII